MIIGINIVFILIIMLGNGLSWFENYVGFYFFYFVDKVFLVEIVKGDDIFEEMIVCVIDFV